MASYTADAARALYYQQVAYRNQIGALYNSLGSHTLEWPSLTLTWLADRKSVDTSRDYALLYLAVGTQTLPSAVSSNVIRVLELAVPLNPIVDDDWGEDGTGDDDNSSEHGGGGRSGGAAASSVNAALRYRCIRGHIRTDQVLPVETPVLKMRSMPQNSEVLAATQTSGDVFIYDCAVRLNEDMEVEEPLTEPHITLSGHKTGAFGLAWHPQDLGRLATGGDDGSVREWSAEGPIRAIGDAGTAATVESSLRLRIAPLRTFTGHQDIVHDVSWHSTQNHLAVSCSADCTIKVWDARTGSCAMTWESAHRVSANSVQFHPLAGFQLCSGGGDHMVKLWDMRKPDRHVHRLLYHTGAVTSVQWAPFAESVLASSGHDRKVCMWDLERLSSPEDYSTDEDGPRELAFLHMGHLSRVMDIAWCPSMEDEWLLASCDALNSVQYYKPKSDVVFDFRGGEKFDEDNGDD